MLLPSVFGENLWDDFDDFMDFPFGRSRSASRGALPAMRAASDPTGLMRTDIKETETGYLLQVDLPGYDKADVSAQLKDGYLTISATRKAENDEKDKDGKYLRRERYYGNAQRTFYLGEGVTQEDIHARYADGILHVTVDKKPQAALNQPTTIAIEG